MKNELEVKILDVDVAALSRKLLSIGAINHGTLLQRRYVYDLKPASSSAWIRLRDNGSKVTLTIKEIHSDKIDGTKELEVVVEDFNSTNEILRYLGFSPRAYQENRRTHWDLAGVAIDIDEWPRIPVYLEVEASTVDLVENTLSQLGYSIKRATSINTEKVYAKYGIDIRSIKELTFE